MADPRFFTKAKALTLQEILSETSAELSKESNAYANRLIEDVAPLDRAKDNMISFLDNPKYINSFKTSEAGACFIREKHASVAPDNMAVLITEDPYRCYARIAQRFYPFIPLNDGIDKRAHIDESAKIGQNTTIAAGAYIGKNVQIGNDCVVCPNAVIADGVMIGNHTRIGALTSISHAEIGNHVVIHRGVHIGQDGFGFSLGKDGHVKVPQLGKVIIEDDVEIGAGSCIDRGTGPDTHIEQGTKIDNLVQIGHNVHIGKGVVIVSQVGISGSTRIGDGVVLGGQAGIAGHLHIGAGARIAAKSGVMDDVSPGVSMGGFPAVRIKDWHRQTIAIKQLIQKQRNRKDDEYS